MNRKFWLFLFALLVLMLALEYQMPRRFQWEPTFAHADRQPFGCYVFDSIISQEMPHGYTVCRKSLSQLALQYTTPRSIVILGSGYQHEDVNVDTLLALAQRGWRILYANSYFSHELCDTLHIYCNSHNYFSLQNFMRESQQRDTIFWTGDTLHYQPVTYFVYPLLFNACLLDSIGSETLAKIHDWETLEFTEEHVSKDSPLMQKDSRTVRVPDIVALSYPFGKGEIIFVTTPLLMTNYGILDCPAYVHRLMNRLKDLPVVRTEAYMSNYNASESSPFREFLKRPPLRWALYLVLLGVVLLMGFNARRRQRAIPVEAPPRNYQLDFVRHIGTLQYLKQKQNRIWKRTTKEEE